VALEGAVVPLPARRIDFPYRREGRPFPDRAPELIACVREEAADLVEALGIEPRRLVLGGRSMGGRMCSMAVAEGLPAAGLVLVSYPLHPPGKPEKLRVEHLPAIDVPCLFISGTRDEFGTPDELAAAHALVAGPVSVVWIDGGRHALKGADAEVVAAVVEWITGL
jgi:predicted alpha/beta-hydrolase family hydrolase